MIFRSLSFLSFFFRDPPAVPTIFKNPQIIQRLPRCIVFPQPGTRYPQKCQFVNHSSGFQRHLPQYHVSSSVLPARAPVRSMLCDTPTLAANIPQLHRVHSVILSPFQKQPFSGHHCAGVCHLSLGAVYLSR